MTVIVTQNLRQDKPITITQEQLADTILAANRRASREVGNERLALDAYGMALCMDVCNALFGEADNVLPLVKEVRTEVEDSRDETDAAAEAAGQAHNHALGGLVEKKVEQGISAGLSGICFPIIDAAESFGRAMVQAISRTSGTPFRHEKQGGTP